MLLLFFHHQSVCKCITYVKDTILSHICAITHRFVLSSMYVHNVKARPRTHIFSLSLLFIFFSYVFFSSLCINNWRWVTCVWRCKRDKIQKETFLFIFAVACPCIYMARFNHFEKKMIIFWPSSCLPKTFVTEIYSCLLIDSPFFLLLASFYITTNYEVYTVVGKKRNYS